MFREKYKSDNELIIPDQSLISSLAEKMKSYQESELYSESPGATVDPTHKRKSIHRIARTSGILAASLSVLVISAVALHYTVNLGGKDKGAELATQSSAFDTSDSAESAVSDSVDTTPEYAETTETGNALKSSPPKLSNSKKESKEECTLDNTDFLLASSEINSISILETSNSSESKKELTEVSNINKFTDFFNTLYSSRDTSILIDVSIDESTGSSIITTFALKDGTQYVFTLFDDSYFKLNNDGWFPLDAQYASEYSQIISSLQE